MQADARLGRSELMVHGWFWTALFLLGCFHGINPGMGWLFAVALGLQEKSTKAVLAALPPIALGHALSIASIVGLAALAALALPEELLRFGSAALLITFGLWRGLRARHPRWVGMRVGAWGLAAWAFLMATGHGAGFMLLPFLLGTGPAGGSHHMIMEGAGSEPASTPHGFGVWLLAVGVHTFGYLLVMTAVALIVYQKLGLQLLRTAWFNFDLAWAAALVLSGVVVAFV